MANAILEVMIGIILLFACGVILAESGIKSLADAGGWMIGSGVAIVIAIIIAVIIVASRN
jgi:hypothetical protein